MLPRIPSEPRPVASLRHPTASCPARPSDSPRSSAQSPTSAASIDRAALVAIELAYLATHDVEFADAAYFAALTQAQRELLLPALQRFMSEQNLPRRVRRVASDDSLACDLCRASGVRRSPKSLARCDVDVRLDEVSAGGGCFNLLHTGAPDTSAQDWSRNRIVRRAGCVTIGIRAHFLRQVEQERVGSNRAEARFPRDWFGVNPGVLSEPGRDRIRKMGFKSLRLRI